MTFLLNPYIYGGWKDISQVTIIPTPSANYQVRIVLNSSNFDYSKSFSNGSDIRFIASATDSPSTQHLPHWIESWNASGNSIIWVKVPTSGTETFYMVYNNSSATSVSSIDNTMETGMRFRYYDGTGFNTLVGGGTDTSVNYNWGSGNVSIAGVGADPDTVSIIWDGWIKPSGSGSHTFFATSDDGERLYARTISDSSGTNTTLVNAWVDRGPTENSAAYSITDGNPKYLEYQWYENGGGAVAQLGWTPPSTGVKVYPIPSANMRSPKYSSTYLSPFTYVGGAVYPRSDFTTSGLVLNYDAALSASYPGSGTTWKDLGGYGYNGTLVNSPTYNASGYLTFNGTNQTVSASKPNPNLTGQISIEAWFYNNGTGDMCPVHKGSHFTIRFPTVDSWTWADSTNYSYANFGTRTVANINQTGVWKQIVVTKDASNIVRIYKNGSLADTSGAFGGALTAATSTLWLSGYSDTDTAPTTRLLNGSMSVVRIYNRALSGTEILANFNALRSRYGL